MLKAFSFIALLFIMGGRGVQAQAQKLSFPVTLFQATEKIPVAPPDSVVHLKHPWILKNSLSFHLLRDSLQSPKLRS
ncbi:MAG TPA: hypothetical protein ENH09_02630, partial [Bacteroidetes bacterium]|nr:hypothetical protein [Bacteroidota bacterium]